MTEETLTYREIARMIDISAVQAPQGETEIRELINYAKEYGFGAVHVLPAWVSFARSLLNGADGIALGAPVGFPSGGNHAAIKRAEAQQMIADGIDELDMMINVGKLRSGDDGYVLDELKAVITEVSVPVKVILETHYLNDDEIKRACAMCIAAGARYVKTSTGWAPTGATMANIRVITSCTGGRIGVKASGGIRNLNTLIEMYRLGVRRFGINLLASVEIVQACRELPEGRVRITP
ncbi:MAG: deoxyribose-phosphate aldolase [Anaerolineaceae bacterium]|nr:deoxyribose-phosphate aldolase [Anaerolineaceae bacterium]